MDPSSLTLDPSSLSMDPSSLAMELPSNTMDSHRTGNLRRASWRVLCRTALAAHINDTLGLSVKPSEVRLMTERETLPYSWELKDPSLQSLFNRHLSKHSVGAYITLTNEVGRSFYAKRVTEAVFQKEAVTVCCSQSEYDELNTTNARLIAELHQVELTRAEEMESKKEAEEVISKLRAAQEESQIIISRLEEENRNLKFTIQDHQSSVSECWEQATVLFSHLDALRWALPAISTQEDLNMSDPLEPDF